jgi:hypothetical protein
MRPYLPACSGQAVGHTPLLADPLELEGARSVGAAKWCRCSLPGGLGKGFGANPARTVETPPIDQFRE